MDVPDQSDICRTVKRPRIDRQALSGTVPKQVRTAGAAKPAPRGRGGFVPARLAGNLHSTSGSRCRRHVMSARLSALPAVACDDRAQRSPHQIHNLPAKAGSPVNIRHSALLSGTRGQPSMPAKAPSTMARSTRVLQVAGMPVIGKSACRISPLRNAAPHPDQDIVVWQGGRKQDGHRAQ